MIKILFICHGNICRSPMAEFVMKDIVNKAGMEQDFHIASAATSREELGNGVHRGTRGVLWEHGIGTDGKTAVQARKEDYAAYDYLIGMDDWNIKNMLRIFGGDPDQKVYRLLEFAGRDGEIADPWYSGDFEVTYQDVKAGCEGLFRQLQNDREGQGR